ncbi:MAG TPA: ATP-binding protein [Kofleriaceae bacterium]|jgi:signal transduction histidine kinase|nr:ATP-binding protein [Kofleriaceae bacterium]
MMKLRDRLLLFSTAQLVVFGVAFALAYGAFHHSVLPMLEDLLRAKTEQIARSLGAELEVPLGADDQQLLVRAVEHVVNQPDFAYLVVRDARDRQVFARGAPPDGPLFAGPESTSRLAPGSSGAWLSISVEGLRLGTAAVGFSTARLDALATWTRAILVGVAVMWLIALTYSFGFARSLVLPIRAMMDFSRMVAGGALSERLATAAPGELRELRDYLNQMTAELERREAEREAAAARAQAMRNELLAVSRMAGMAEIATGVLHNVGNVLNSLNVSVTTISDQMRSSRVAGLTRSLELVDAFPGGLSAFLGTDKGKVLPAYLSTVSRHLASENARVLDELDSVNRNVEHIKTIVAMQQSYARPTGLRQTVVIAELIDDALHMGETSFARHGIEVIADYARDLTLVTDRHKVLQILINLISNARHALQEQRSGSQQLTVRATATMTTLTVTVTDTGVGIPAENLDKIFQHGFTTKPGGHGFGLHASANAARELGGSLQVASDGTGRGASFTLELPRQSDEGSHDQRN